MSSGVIIKPKGFSFLAHACEKEKVKLFNHCETSSKKQIKAVHVVG